MRELAFSALLPLKRLLVPRRCARIAAMCCAVFLTTARGGAADLLSDRDALESKVAEVVRPYLRTAPTDKTADEKPGGSAVKAKTSNGQAWAIVVGATSEKGRNVFGFGRLGADSAQSADGRTLFEIGSITKTFTALLLADLVERGKMNLDDPVQQYLPESVKMPQRGGKEITLLHLATHTSGLPRLPPWIRWTAIVSPNPYKSYGADDLYKTLAGIELARDPGEQYDYSNLAFGLLGHALCRQAGKGYEELVLDRVCRPLGLRDTCVALTAEQKQRFAAPYDADGTAASNWDFDVIAGAGALRSTADDMLTYIEANMGIHESDLLPAMRRCHVARHPAESKIQSICLGWHEEKMSQGARLVFHGGGTGGYSTFVGFVEEKGGPTFGLVVLTNAATAPAANIANDVAVKLLNVLHRH